MTIYSWPLWLAIFVLATITILGFKKKTKTHIPKGNKDTNIHSKPLFKMATFFIVFMMAIFLLSVYKG